MTLAQSQPPPPSPQPQLEEGGFCGFTDLWLSVPCFVSPLKLPVSAHGVSWIVESQAMTKTLQGASAGELSEDFLGLKVQENPASFTLFHGNPKSNTNIRIRYSVLTCCEPDNKISFYYRAKDYILYYMLIFPHGSGYLILFWRPIDYRNRFSIICQPDLTYTSLSQVKHFSIFPSIN